MPAQFKTRPRALASALTCSVFLTPLLASAETAPAAASATDRTPAPQQAAAVDASGTLPTIAIQSSALSDMQVKRSPSYKFTAPLLDTPRSITVIPEQLIKEKNVTSFADALRSVPGITFLGGDAAANPSADRPVIRGFESRNSIFVDGMRDSGLQNRETFAIEQISVVKGPDSVYAGRGSVGGSVDIVTKTPQNDNFINSSIGFGTDGYKRATIDANRKIDDTTAVRLNVMGHDANQAGRNDVYNKRWGVAPSIVFGLNTPTTVTLSYYHMNSYDMPDFSVPFRSTGGTPVPTDRGQFFGLNTRDYRYGQTDTGEVRVEHRFNDDWKLKNTTMFGRSTLDYVATNPQILASDPNMLSLQAKSGKYATNGIANQTEVTGRANLFGMQHTMTAGVEFGLEQNRYEGYLVTDSLGNNIRSGGPCTVTGNCTPIAGGWNPNMPWTGNIVLNGDKSFPGPTTNTRTTTASAYIFDTVKLTEQWLFNAGLRFDRYDITAKQAGVADLSNTSNLFSYQFGLVFKPVRTVSLYASYGTSSNPPGSNGGLGGGSDQITANNQSLSPERSRNIEVGAKWDVIDGQLSLTSALFDTEKTNAQVSDGLGHTINAGKQRVRGAELGFAGNLTGKWHVFGGYSYLNAVTVDAGPGNPGGSGLPMVMVPKHNFTLWTSYDVLPKLTLGAGATVMSKTYASVSQTVKKWTPGYARFDAAATWRVNKTMDVQLNVQNLFDKKYYASAYPIYATWAPGRSAMVTLNFYQ
ncbi:TonB-dependent receptor [Burkholderia pseudomultivorans]|uniref:TonB-dependent receptor n=1 Tax=Burkholderia pseudomultivorans TaxID=1207504 RepID=UPI00075D537A|nr:TonB-dependent receptor [Burkholderia pseudomultivorans]AOI88782.1 ligand-gated channel protein [Burkholderia pseudomultivorans]KVC34213.1 ligand-gated channel protein [Burkholderia pseudomultivorans]KVC42492.1 ligand-gated channel protein [Burkholderia pseudomultivorans]KVC46287.1 ligand-gated channel protein [Burkholderia pseudomultivorans]MDS0791337.1 TonB-dependent receptor [Burkholderia pseudomultivorans]